MICPGCGAVHQDALDCALCGTPAIGQLAEVDAYEAINDWVETVRKWDPMVALDDLGPSVDRAAWLLARTRDMLDALKLADSILSRFISDIRPANDPYEVDGVGAVTVRWGSARTQWAHGELTPKVVARIAEKQGYPIAPIRAVVDAWLAVASPSWKVTGLKELGIDPDEYCQKRPGEPRVVIE